VGSLQHSPRRPTTYSIRITPKKQLWMRNACVRKLFGDGHRRRQSAHLLGFQPSSGNARNTNKFVHRDRPSMRTTIRAPTSHFDSGTLRRQNSTLHSYAELTTAKKLSAWPTDLVAFSTRTSTFYRPSTVHQNFHLLPSAVSESRRERERKYELSAALFIRMFAAMLIRR
jgi:hypothetical protein